MSIGYFDRYKDFRGNGTIKMIPGIKLYPKSSDKQIVYQKNKTRFDILSQQYYNSPFFGFLILLANPQFGGIEFKIPDGELIRIPFPLNSTLEQYNEEVKKHIRLYGE